MSDQLAYGTWPTPITAELVVRASVSLGGPAVSNGWIWWSELRPAEKGRVQVVGKPLAADPSSAVDLLPDGFSARSRVHEYGGTSFWLHGDTLVFADADDQRLYRIDRAGTPEQGAPVAITPEPASPGALRYIDVRFVEGGRWLVCVREEHGRAGAAEAVNEIVTLALDGSSEPAVLVAGADFVSHPRPNADGTRLCWLQWDHPDMPWDQTELWVADLAISDAGPEIAGERRVAGGASTSIAQPEWRGDALSYVSDQGEGWWNVWCTDGPAPNGSVSVERVSSPPGDMAQPQWVFGQSWYAWLGGEGADGLWATVRRDGRDHVAAATAFTGVDGVCTAGPSSVAFIGATFTDEAAVVEVSVVDGSTTVHRPPRDLGLDPSWYSVPEHITFPTTDLGVGASEAHALFYRPRNPGVPGPADPTDRPPLLVLSHGGPTSAARPMLQLAVQYWTSRGFAVADVNYRGSVGYGRAYRDALRGQWGIADVDDCIACARHLAAVGVVDGARLAIKGGSAGGYTTLCALAFHDDFRAGSSLYGVADLETLAADTHKFESRYLDGLVGPYPERRDIYEARSPVHHLDGLSCPLIIFQGLDDEVVPPAQAEQMVAALRAKGLPFAYLAFPGEQHGFRQAANMMRVLEAEHYFFSRVFGFAPPSGVEPVTIENLPG